MPKVQLYDTTLRDGAQREGVSFSVGDKLRIAQKLDELGIQFIEGGWPGSNPKDTEFFQRAQKLTLKNSTLVAFGSTRRPKTRVEDDANLSALLDASVAAVAMVGKSSGAHVVQVLETDLDENLKMISDSIRYLRSNGVRVIFDAEHFFDGFKADPAYALHSLKVAGEAGAECLVLCDTNGGTLPRDVVSAFEAARKVTGIPLGIHTHNDAGVAVANTLVAVESGAVHVQGTINGYGERCGNANLCSIIPALKLKMGIDCITDAQLAKLTEVSRYISDISNLVPDPFSPYVGASAFSHKGGLHVSAMAKWVHSYQHIDPVKVGNKPRVLVSELSGRRNIIQKAKELGFHLLLKAEVAQKLLKHVKLMESRGFQYESAEASFELLLHRAKPDYRPPFELVDFLVVIERKRRTTTRKGLEDMLSEAMVKVRIGNEVFHTAAEGNGPINALDRALRKALMQFYPHLVQVKLVDYKVRILDENEGTESKVRVFIAWTDGTTEWQTVGSSTDIIEASWLALADSLEYWLIGSPMPLP